jgi:glutathione transport system ATP-binding protein
MESNCVVDVQDLRVYFPLEDSTVKAVDGISFHINKGETVAVVGESGSGKSVSAMALMRLNDASGGKMPTGAINLRLPDDRVVDVVKLPENELRDIRGNAISMIFQEPMTSLNPVYTIGFQIAEAIMLHQGMNEKQAEARALEMLKLVRIPEPEKQLKQYPHHLSGGMRQRVMIAMALSCRPQLLIADEPTTALDVTIQAQILDLIKTLQEEIGMAVLFITHDMGVVAEVADRVVVMFKGQIVEQGKSETIFHRPEHPYTRALINAVPKLGSMNGKDKPEKFPDVAQTDTFKPEDFGETEPSQLTIPATALSADEPMPLAPDQAPPQKDPYSVERTDGNPGSGVPRK